MGSGTTCRYTIAAGRMMARSMSIENLKLVRLNPSSGSLEGRNSSSSACWIGEAEGGAVGEGAAGPAVSGAAASADNWLTVEPAGPAAASGGAARRLIAEGSV